MTHEPQPGDIGLTQVEGDIGRLIRLGQYLNGDGFADFEHCFVHVGDNQIVEAEPGGALLSPLEKYDARNLPWLRCPPGHGEAVADAARGLIGTPYSFLDYLALAAHRLHIPAPGLRHRIQSSKHLICSQLCDLAAQRGGWRIFNDGRWEGFATPGDLYQQYLAQARAGTTP